MYQGRGDYWCFLIWHNWGWPWCRACGSTPQWQWRWDWNRGPGAVGWDRRPWASMSAPMLLQTPSPAVWGNQKGREREGHRQVGELLSRWAAKHPNFYHATAGHYNGHNFGDWALSAIHLMLLKLWTTKQIIIRLALSLKQIHRII